MTRISSRKTFLFKKVLPLLIIAWPVLIFAPNMPDGTMEDQAIDLGVPVLIAVIACCLVFWYMRRLADEVVDQGNQLLVSRRGEREQIFLSNIMNVGCNSTIARIPIIALRLAKPSKFGSEIVFLPVTKFSLSLGGKNAVAEGLIERTYEAKSTRGI